MPFITPDRRAIIQEKGLVGLNNIMPGDRCFVFYKELITEWRKEPRWTTVHNLMERMAYQFDFLDQTDCTAYRLAWEVFFQLEVIPYELKQREVNGDVE